ncbi:hypothetical protein D3C71_1965840 [compost metagenome]
MSVDRKPPTFGIVGVRSPPAENIWIAVLGVHSVNQLSPLPAPKALVNAVVFCTSARPASLAPVTTRSPRVLR